ncbi:MAG: FCD domain-containing protein [Thermodesulfobacteriota bacterium]
MGTGLRAAKRKKAYEEVAEAIRAQVFSGRLRVDQRLPPERELAERFGVSRVVLREAIRTLELAGILRVQKGAGGGTFVCHRFDKPLSTSVQNLLSGGAISLEHLFEMRLLLEPPAAALAARRADAAGRRSLEEALAQAEAVKDDARALRAQNLEFHRRLAVLADNPLLASLCDTMINILVASLEGKPSLETSRAVYAYHQKITQAVKQGQAEQARRLTMEDLETLKKRYRQMGIEVSGAAARRKVG